MTSALLSICIPTFNRAQSLEVLLDVIAPVKAQYGPKLEVFIADNSSDDTTPVILRRYVSIYDYRYVRHISNLGSQANFEYLFNHATGSYIWFVGDDDLISPSELVNFLSFLDESTSPYALILLDTLRPPYQPGDTYLSPSRYGTYTPSQLRWLVLRKGLQSLGHCTSFAINRDIFKTSFAPLSVSSTCRWTHQVPLLKLLSLPTCPSYVWPKPIALQGVDREPLSLHSWLQWLSTSWPMVFSLDIPIPLTLRFLLLFRCLYSRDFISQVILIAYLSPFYPVFRKPDLFSPQTHPSLALCYSFLLPHLVLYTFVSALSFFDQKLSAVRRFYSSRYSIEPSTGAPKDADRFTT